MKVMRIVLLGTVVSLLLGVTGSLAQESSDQFQITSSFIDDSEVAPANDTVTASLSTAAINKVKELCGCDPGELKVTLLILNPGSEKYVAILNGSGNRSYGDSAGARHDEEVAFFPLLATADAKQAYGLGMFLIRDHIKQKAVRIRVEIQLQHNVRQSRQKVQITGITHWSAVEPFSWKAYQLQAREFEAQSLLMPKPINRK